MYLQYGSVTLKVIDLLRYDREAIYTPDKTDLLTIRHTLGVSAVYAPGGDPRMPSVTALSEDTEKVLSGQDRTAEAVSRRIRGYDPGQLARVEEYPHMEHNTVESEQIAMSRLHSGPQTDAELRYRLMLPRQKLILWAYDRQTGKPIRWLESPRPGMATDAMNGPLPIGNPVVSAAGEPNSIGVYFEVQTDVLPCATGSDRAVLSHRWQMTHVGDENNYLTRVTHGEIIFNGEYVHTMGVVPDDFRNQFIHPIPVGFVRRVPEVTQSSDGLTLRYTILDTDPTVVFDAGDSGATMLEILEKITYNAPWAGSGQQDATGRGGSGRPWYKKVADPFNLFG